MRQNYKHSAYFQSKSATRMTRTYTQKILESAASKAIQTIPISLENWVKKSLI